MQSIFCFFGKLNFVNSLFIMTRKSTKCKMQLKSVDKGSQPNIAEPAEAAVNRWSPRASLNFILDAQLYCTFLYEGTKEHRRIFVEVFAIERKIQWKPFFVYFNRESKARTVSQFSCPRFSSAVAANSKFDCCLN